MFIAVDFDGTCVTHSYPDIGSDIGAVPVLKELVENGHQLILWTMRSDDAIGVRSGKPSRYLSEAVEWFNSHDIQLYSVQHNPTQKSWTDSPKAYANLYIDDAALGCPLIHNPKLSVRPYVDWVKIREHLVDRFAITS